MKKLLSTPAFFKLIFVFTLLFSGISFNVTAQTQQDSIKSIFDKAILDIAKVTSKGLIDASTVNNKDALKSKVDNYQDFKEFNDEGQAKKDIPNIQSIIKKANKSDLKVNGKDIITDSTTIRQIIANIFAEIKVDNNYKSKKINTENLNKEFNQIVEEATKKANDLVKEEQRIEKEKRQQKTEDSLNSLPKEEEVKDIIPVVVEEAVVIEDSLIIPKEYQEYVLLASLGLIVVLLLLILFTNNNLSSLKNKVKRLSTSKSTNKSDFDSSKFVFEHVFKTEKEQLETKIQELQKTIHSLTNDIETLKVKNDKISIEKSPIETIYTPPINPNPSNNLETKYAKDPSEPNGFLNSYLQSQNDSEAVYIIYIMGQHAAFEINQQNNNAMQRAMIDTGSFFGKACDMQGIPDIGKRPRQISKGELQLKDNVWHITKKAKIEFV